MKNPPVQFVLLLFVVAGLSSSADQSENLPAVSKKSSVTAQPNTPAQDVSNEGSYYADFDARFKAAVQGRDIKAIEALYQTNGVSGEESHSELTCWQPFLAEDKEETNPRASRCCEPFYFKDLSKAWIEWTTQAHARTTHSVSHLVFVRWMNGNLQGSTMLPLVLVQGQLFIVPSDKRKPMFGPSSTLKLKSHSTERKTVK